MFTGVLSSQATGREPTRVFPEQKAGQERRCLRGEVQLHLLSDQDGRGWAHAQPQKGGYPRAGARRAYAPYVCGLLEL